MKKFALILLIALTSCVYKRESLGTYVLPVTGLKDATKEGKVCDNEDNFPFDRTIDLTVETARKRAQITNITAIESEQTRELFKRKRCIIVRGN